MVSMISRRHRAVVVKVAFVVGVLYLMGMLKVARDTPSKEEERMEANDPEDQSGERPKIEEPNFEPPKLEPPILEFPDEKAANNQDGNEIEDTKRDEENEKKRLEEEKEELLKRFETDADVSGLYETDADLAQFAKIDTRAGAGGGDGARAMPACGGSVVLSRCGARRPRSLSYICVSGPVSYTHLTLPTKA